MVGQSLEQRLHESYPRSKHKSAEYSVVVTHWEAHRSQRIREFVEFVDALVLWHWDCATYGSIAGLEGARCAGLVSVRQRRGEMISALARAREYASAVTAVRQPFWGARRRGCVFAQGPD